MMFGVTKLAFLYLLLLGSGARMIDWLPLKSFLGKVLMAFTLGAAQLLVSIQILSLFRHLTGGWLLLLNGLITGAVFFAARRQSQHPRNLRWREITENFRTALGLFRQHPLEGAMLAAALVAITIGCATSIRTYPMTDDYHFAMPLYWMQHASILPFPSFDPRLIGVTFASEGLAFPGYLYARTGAMFALFTGLAALLLIWIVMGIARQLGASLKASLCTGAILGGLGPIANSLFGAMADHLLSAMWFSGAVYFLLESRSRDAAGVRPLEMGCSLLCVLMACASKNIVALEVPSYVLGTVLLHGRSLLGRRCLTVMAMSGFAGMVASGVLWSYVSNAAWFGDLRGDRNLKENVSTEHYPRAIWTRVTRGAVTVLFDVIWLPQRYHDTYGRLCVQTVQALGGQDRLAEDHDFYSFTGNALRPGLGFGLLGILFFVPGLIAGIAHACRRRPPGPPEKVFPASGVLVLITLGSFLTCYTVLRWQSIGLARLMIPCAVAGLPLAALLCERAWARFAGAALLILSLGMYCTAGLGIAFRRLNTDERFGLARKLTHLQRDRSRAIEYRWQEGPPVSIRLREEFTHREIHQLFLSRIPEPAVIGMNGRCNAESYYLFGRGYSNRVVSLVDTRAPHRLLMPLPVDYIVLEEPAPAPIDAQTSAMFDLFFEAKHKGKPVLSVLKRNTATPP
jgi:hypothetical protein